ncbi:MAG TPA: hypothetical protein VFT56_07525 [Sphingomonas sp.]|nr:hypothetical protein [Sphingomonas sp.]
MTTIDRALLSLRPVPILRKFGYQAPRHPNQHKRSTISAPLVRKPRSTTLEDKRRAAAGRLLLPVLFSLFWILSLPHLAIGLSPRLLRFVWLGQLAPNFGSLLILWLARRSSRERTRTAAGRPTRAAASGPK